MKYKDNSKEILSQLEKKIQNGLFAIGSTAEGYAKDGCPVDTGRLRNSITFATSGHSSSDIKSTPDDTEVVIGTNVNYAKYVELGEYQQHKTGAAHFLRNAIQNHINEYEKLLNTALK